MTAKKNILIICSSLNTPGGIERAIVNTANLLQTKGCIVSILILDTAKTSFFPIVQSIAILQEHLHFGITNKGNFISRKLSFLNHVKILRRKIQELSPDVILTTEYPFTIATSLAAVKLSTKIFAWEHHHFHHLPKSGFWKRMHKWIYPKTAGVICLNKEEAALYQSLGCITTVIPNFIEQNEKAELQETTLLTVGWLSKTKGVDFIPLIAEKIFSKHPDWSWRIIGSGEEEKKLKQELVKRNLDKYVSVITPSTHQLRKDYLSASVYVMTSRVECFPMVLLEAMSHGVPCVSFNCATGPKHIINDGENGFLVNQNDVDAMGTAINELISDDEKRKLFGANAHASITRFHPDKISGLWDGLLLNND